MTHHPWGRAAGSILFALRGVMDDLDATAVGEADVIRDEELPDVVLYEESMVVRGTVHGQQVLIVVTPEPEPT